jgi:hypothetical protein
MNTNDEDNSINLLKDLINNLSSRELSILQIVQEKTGIITLNDNDCLWIKHLSRSSLQNEEEYFPKSDTQLNFNFLYIQFYIIRSYLLLCHINYHHIHQKYQCYTQRQMILPTDKRISDKLFYTLNDPQFNSLQEMTLSKLYNGYNLLRQILDIKKHYQDDLSNINLYEFIQRIDDNNQIYRQLEKYEIKDFQLCYIDDICQLYEQLINNFHYSIINTSHLLHIPIDNQQNLKLDQLFDITLIQSHHNEEAEKLQSTIRTITEFLNELKDIEDTLLQQSSQSLTQICKWVAIENPILSLIPNEIKCENYISLIIKLIEIQTKLQEQTINIEEKIEEKWNDDFIYKSDQQQDQSDEQQITESIFEIFRKPIDESKDSGSSTITIDETIFKSLQTNIETTTTDINPNQTSNGDSQSNNSQTKIDNTITYETIFEQSRSSSSSSYSEESPCRLFELNIKSVPLTPSILFQKVRDQQLDSSSIPNLSRFEIIHPDGSRQKAVCKIENIYLTLKTKFEEKKYNFDKFVIVDQNQIFVDFLNENTEKLSTRISSAYQIIEKISLIPIVLEYESNQIEYLATSKCQISSIINRFITDHKLTFTSPDLYLGFFDELETYIDEDKTIFNIYRSNNTNPIQIKIIKYQDNTNNLYEISLRSQEGIYSFR